MPRRSHSRPLLLVVRANVLWGLRHARWYAAVFAIVGVLASLADPAGLARSGFTVPSLISYILSLALVLGAAVGLLRPIGRTLSGAAIMGWVAGTLFLLVATLWSGTPLNGKMLRMAVGFGSLGLPVGIYFRWRFGRPAVPPAA